MEDAHLAHAAAQGDPDAFRQLVERYRAYIYSIAYRIVLHEDDALDVTQNVYLRLTEKLGQYNGRGTFRGWLATLTAREAITHQRRPARRETPTEPDTLARIVEEREEREEREGGRPQAPAPADDPRSRILRDERRRLVEDAMITLSPQQRTVFMLRFHEDLGPKEIAERLDLPDKQVRSQLHRAVVGLRRRLAEKGQLE